MASNGDKKNAKNLKKKIVNHLHAHQYWLACIYIKLTVRRYWFILQQDLYTVWTVSFFNYAPN